MSTATTKPTPNPFQYSGIPGKSYGIPLPTSWPLPIDRYLTTLYSVSQAGVATGVEQFDIDSGVLPGEVTSEFDSSFTDTSSTLFSQYLSYADKHDTEQAESWKASAEGTLVFVCNRFLFWLVILSLFMNRTLTNNSCIILIVDGTICCCTSHVRDRQLQIFVTRLGEKRRRPSLTNIPATRRSLQRDPGPDHSLFSFYPYAVQYTTISPASLCGLGKLTLVSEPRHISLLLSTRNAPTTLGPQIPPSDATSRHDP
jgi:hypothetical protein